MVSVVVAPPAVGVTGLAGEKLAVLHAGNGEPVPLTLQVRLTGELYPLTAVKVTVEMPEVPGATADGVVAAGAVHGDGPVIAAVVLVQ